MSNIIGSASTKFRMRFNNYSSCFNRYTTGVSVPQASFHAHFKQTGHNGMNDWSFTLIDHATNTKALRRKEMYWQYKFNTFNRPGQEKLLSRAEIAHVISPTRAMVHDPPLYIPYFGLYILQMKRMNNLSVSV